jgi:hypothetical protein
MDTKMKSLNVKEEDIEEGEAGPKGETLAKDMKSGYGSPPSMKGVGAFNKSLFKSASAAKAGSPCDIKPEKKDSKLVWEDGKSSKEEPIEGFYGESPNKPEDDEDKKKDVKKSLTELRYGAQPLRAFDINKSCGVCGRLSKSAGEAGHEGHSGCCEDCKKSMNSVRWHESHLA